MLPPVNTTSMGITNTRQGRFADGGANLRQLGPFSQQLKKLPSLSFPFRPLSLFIYFIFLNQNRSNHLGPEVTQYTVQMFAKYNKRYQNVNSKRLQLATVCLLTLMGNLAIFLTFV
jgi:hypothetical protein